MRRGSKERGIASDISDIAMTAELARISLGKPPSARWDVLGAVYGFTILDRKPSERKTSDQPAVPTDQYDAIASLFGIELIRENRRVVVSGIKE